MDQSAVGHRLSKHSQGVEDTEVHQEVPALKASEVHDSLL